jgi:hypothetical protein
MVKAELTRDEAQLDQRLAGRDLRARPPHADVGNARRAKLMAPFDVRRGVLPPGYRLLTGGIDKQESKYVVNVDAWASGRTSHTADYFECDDEDELLAALDEEYRTADGKRLKIALSLLDSGFRPKDVHALVERAKQRGIKLIPCRGSTRPLGPGVMYARSGSAKTRPGPALPTCWSTRATRKTGSIGSCTTRKPGAPGGTSLFRAELAEHQDFLEQLLNEAPVDEQWQVVDENVPVDYRDAKRYAAVAMLLRRAAKRSESRSQEAGGPGAGRTPQQEAPNRSGRANGAIARPPYAGLAAGSTCHER